MTGQAAWYDLRVRVEKAAAPAERREPRFAQRCRAAACRRAPTCCAMARNSAREAAAMTSLPAPGAKKLGLVIDLDICVGCHACAVNCKEWNTGGHRRAADRSQPLRQRSPDGVWFNRVHTYEAGDGADGRTVHFPRSCLHCEEPACVTVCPTGASYKRAEDGIVLVNDDICIGCKLCSWACPYGAREFDDDEGVMKKCTLCIDRIYNENLAGTERVPACVATCPASARHFGDLGDPDIAVSQLVAERGGYDLMPEMGYTPDEQISAAAPARAGAAAAPARARAGVRRRRRLAPLDRSAACRLIDHASRALGHLVHHRVGRGLRPAGLARRAGAAAGCCRADRGFGVAVARARARRSSRVGLLSSTFHLGHPERAWRAFSQWRISWLSREGVLVGRDLCRRRCSSRSAGSCSARTGGIWALFGALAASARSRPSSARPMIYRSLKPIQRWHNAWVLPNYLRSRR